MKRRFFALLTTFALMLSAAGFSFANTKNSKKSVRETTQLATQLPASDAVIALDMQRLVKTVLPQILSAKPQLMTDINAQIDDIKNQIGIDLRQFDQLAIGLMFKKDEAKAYDFEPVVLARGHVNVVSILELAKTASKGKYREEKVASRTIYVFPAKEIVQANKPNLKTPQEEEDFNKMLGRVPAELAAAVLSDNTLAIGLPARVRETIGGKSRVGADVLALVNRKPNSIISFGANMPQNPIQFFNLDDDEIGKIVNMIRQVSGAMDVIGGNTAISVVAKTLQPQQAKELQETLEGFQTIGASALAMSKGDDKKIYAKMAQNIKITRNNTDVALDLQIAQSDIDVLLGKK
jgi:hypothetical protein